MKIRVLKENQDGMLRVETAGDIKEVLVNEDFIHPEGESISLCFRGKSSSGIVNLTPKEIEMLYDSVKRHMHLIRGMKKLD